MKPVLLIVGALIIILEFSAMMLGLDAFRMKQITAMYNVTTGGAVTTTSVNLTQELFNSATINVVSVTSNNTGDAPLAIGYTTASKNLQISGMEASANHQLTVIYKTDALTDYIGAAAGVVTLPLMLILGVIGIVCGAVYVAFDRRGAD